MSKSEVDEIKFLSQKYPGLPIPIEITNKNTESTQILYANINSDEITYSQCNIQNTELPIKLIEPEFHFPELKQVIARSIRTTSLNLPENQYSFEDVIKSIKNFDLTHLNKLQTTISEQIKILEYDDLIKSIKHKIKFDGYAVDAKKIEIPNTNMLQLKYYVKLQAYDVNYNLDTEIIDTYDDQDSWVDLLQFEYYATKSDNYEGIIGEWDYCNYLCSAKGYIFVYLYYETQKIPVDDFKVLIEIGNILDCRSKNSKIEVIGSGEILQNAFIVPKWCYASVSDENDDNEIDNFIKFD